MALRDHLGADDDVDLAGGNVAQDPRNRTLAPNRVAVNPSDAGLWKCCAHVRLEPLGPNSGLLQVLASAGAALARHRRRVIAVMAAHAPRGAVVRERHTAVRTLHRRAALPAENHRRK